MMANLMDDDDLTNDATNSSYLFVRSVRQLLPNFGQYSIRTSSLSENNIFVD